MPRRAVPNRSHLSALACLLLLNACGGGGSSSSTAGSSSPTGPTTGNATTFTLSGVVATGAPLPGASIKVVDSSGAAVGLVDAAGNTLAAGTTNLTDGSYSIILNTGSPKVPLLIEASGIDVSGNPVVLHSTLQAASTPAVANITPATEAVVAQVLGADPKMVFQKAPDNTSAIATLGNSTAVTGAADNLKAIIAANLTDGKVASAKNLDFFKDSTFIANKSGLDASLEGLRIQVVKDSTGKDQLQISNKLLNPGTTEVAVDLATARTELSKSSGTVANAITSSTKKTTSSSTSAAHLDVLDDLTAAVNKLIAQGANTAAFSPTISVTPAPNSAVIAQNPVPYSYFGRTKTALLAKLAAYGANNYQLSKFQVTGCVEDPISSKGCAYIGVSANVTDASGKLIEVFNDAVVYSKSTSPNWLFSGNGRGTEIGVSPAGVTSFGADGTQVVDTSNPNFGIQIAIRAQDDTGAQTVSSALVTLPNGHTVNLAYCGQPLLCLTASSTATATSTGELKDNLLQQPTINWIGTQDTTAGAKYAVTYNLSAGNAAHKGNAYLRANLVTDTPVSAFPVPDGIKTTPLTSAALLAGTTLTWNDWAAANPTIKVLSARVIVTGTGGTSPVIKDALVVAGKKNTVTTPVITLAQGFTATGYQLWLVGQDASGRRLYSKFSVNP